MYLSYHAAKFLASTSFIMTCASHHRARLRLNWRDIVRDLEPKDVADDLYQDGIISQRDMEILYDGESANRRTRCRHLLFQLFLNGLDSPTRVIPIFFRRLEEKNYRHLSTTLAGRHRGQPTEDGEDNGDHNAENCGECNDNNDGNCRNDGIGKNDSIKSGNVDGDDMISDNFNGNDGTNSDTMNGNMKGDDDDDADDEDEDPVEEFDMMEMSLEIGHHWREVGLLAGGLTRNDVDAIEHSNPNVSMRPMKMLLKWRAPE